MPNVRNILARNAQGSRPPPPRPQAAGVASGRPPPPKPRGAHGARPPPPRPRTGRPPPRPKSPSSSARPPPPRPAQTGAETAAASLHSAQRGLRGQNLSATSSATAKTVATCLAELVKIAGKVEASFCPTSTIEKALADTHASIAESAKKKSSQDLKLFIQLHHLKVLGTILLSLVLLKKDEVVLKACSNAIECVR